MAPAIQTDSIYPFRYAHLTCFQEKRNAQRKMIRGLARAKRVHIGTLFGGKGYETSLGWMGGNGRSFHQSQPRYNSGEDHYQVLGVDRTASQADIKKAYHKAAMKFHPDRTKGDKEAEQRFAKINAAYDVLKDEKKRSQYDKFGDGMFNGGGYNGGAGGFEDVDLNDIFENMFGGFGGGFNNAQSNRMNQRGADIEIPLSIDFMEAVKGTKKSVSFASQVKCDSCDGKGAKSSSSIEVCKVCGGRGVETFNNGLFPVTSTCRACGGEGHIIRNPCGTCKGSGTIRKRRTVPIQVPAGVDDAMNVRVAGEGDAGRRGGPSGNLYIRIRVPPHPIFKREKSDVHVDIPITVSQAILGDVVEIPTLDGSDKIKVPAGLQPNEKRVLRGRGIPDVSMQSRKKGNQYIHFKVNIPKSLSDKQRGLMEEFAKEDKMDESILSRFKSFFSSFNKSS